VTQVKKSQISFKVGLLVVFLKKTLVEAKIRAGTTQEGTQQQLDLFRHARKALGGALMQKALHNKFAFDERPSYKGPFGLLFAPFESCIPQMQKMTELYPESTIEDDEELEKQIKIMERKLRAIDAILAERDPGESTEEMTFFLSQLVVIRKALDNVIAWRGDTEQGSRALAEASFATKV
jgi:hypothetical protein